MQHTDIHPSAKRRRYLIRAAVASTAIAGVLGVAAPAFAVGNGNFTPPPGCTGSWNTAQSAANNHAPGTSQGCIVAMSHTS